MTDIRKAIRELRDAIESGEGWKVVLRAYDALEAAVLDVYGPNHPVDALHILERNLRGFAKWEIVDHSIYRLESSLAVDKDSPNLDSAIQAAAEEIGNELILTEQQQAKVVAIFRKHVGGGK